MYGCVNGMEGCVWMCEWNGGMCIDVLILMEGCVWMCERNGGICMDV